MIQLAFNESLNQNKWMDNETKLKAIEKLEHINVVIGSSDDQLNSSFVNKMFEKVCFKGKQLKTPNN